MSVVPDTIQEDFANSENPHENYTIFLAKLNDEIKTLQEEHINTIKIGDQKKAGKVHFNELIKKIFQ